MRTAMINGRIGILLLVVLSAGCERPIPIQDQPSGINGYEIQGTVTDQVGNPVPHVKILLDYLGSYVWTDTAATRRYFVSDPNTPIQAVVTDWNGRIVRALTQPENFFGWYQVLWDGKDSAANIPPSGIYSVVYRAGGVPKFSYNQLVSGGQVASTDENGEYTIPPVNLPIDSSSVPFFSSYDSTYVGNLLISNQVIVTFVYAPAIHQIQRALDRNQVTVMNLVLQ